MTGDDGPLPAPVETLSDAHRELWVVALLSYGLGDSATTVAGLVTGRGAEAGPLASGLVAGHGVAGFLALKLLTLLAFYAAYRFVWTPGRVAVPLSLAVVGVTVTVWNLLVLATP